MKQVSIGLQRGQYGESIKPTSVPKVPKIITQGPNGQTSENLSVPGAYLRGMGKISA